MSRLLALLLPLLSEALPPTCKCVDRSLCAPLARRNSPREIFPNVDGHSFPNGSKVVDWRRINMSLSTSMSYYFGHPWQFLSNGTVLDVPSQSNYTTAGFWPDYELLCAAHKADVKVAVGVGTHSGPASLEFLPDPVARGRAVSDLAELVRRTSVDGLQLDFEELADAANATAIRTGYVAFVRELVAALRADNAHAQLTVSTACLSNPEIALYYDFAALADAADGIFLMCYDMNHRRRPKPGYRSYAAANAPLPAVLEGVSSVLALGVEPSKIIMGVPWYGYEYSCVSKLAPVGDCATDANAVGIGYPDAQAAAARGCTTRFDANSSSPLYECTAPNGTRTQGWYDDARSTAIKFTHADALALAGVGFWTSDDAGEHGEALWGAVVGYVRP